MIEPDKYYSVQDVTLAFNVDRRTIMSQFKTQLNPTGIPFLQVGMKGQYRMLGRDILKAFDRNIKP